MQASKILVLTGAKHRLLGGHDDGRYAAFILKWLTPHSLPSA
jgi:hypothetical protein